MPKITTVLHVLAALLLVGLLLCFLACCGAPFAYIAAGRVSFLRRDPAGGP